MRGVLWGLGVVLSLAACSGSSSGTGDPVPWLPSGPRVAVDGALTTMIELPAGAGEGLVAAAEDLDRAMAVLSGAIAGPDAPMQSVSNPKVRVVAAVDDSLAPESYRIEVRPPLSGDEDYSGPPTMTVTGGDEVGAMYGLYEVVERLGVQYIHPEETYWPPANPELTLPWDYTGELQSPAFAVRGFHEHTQHPIPASDFLLRAGEPGFRDMATRYITWLARNRQNFFSFHLLKTVEMDQWQPYMAAVVGDAHARGVKVGAFLSFVDQQQNCFKLLDEEGSDSQEQQIADNLDRVLAAGLDMVGFQIGSSEFTKPADADVLRWLNHAVSHLRDNHPGVRPYAWIHITCDLEGDEGGYFFHVPLQADSDLGAFVHTTMFYTLEHPAPVYDCEDFTHQIEFLVAADGERPQIFFPESAWWLGFDNNLPLVLPLTGWSRAHDILQLLPDYQVEGHVTFTTGREWTYWQYDHYLTKVTWSGALTWEAYLESLAPLYGEAGAAAVAALVAFTERQRVYIYEEQPEIMFYLSGELTQDEIGWQAGVIARRPKIAFREVYDYDEATFAAWEQRDLEMLRRMQADFAALVAPLPASLEGGSPMQRKLYEELHTALAIFVRRLDHTILLYEGVAAARAGEREAAEAKLAAARVISAEVKAVFEHMESLYRYPTEMLARDKPASLTAYPFGYLSQTTTAYFWTRRDQQLADLIGYAFDAVEQRWETTPERLFTAAGQAVHMTEPADPLTASVIASFVPQMLFGLTSYDAGTGRLRLIMGQDHDRNLLPDPGSEQAVDGIIQGAAWEGTLLLYTLGIRDNAGREMGMISIHDPQFSLTLDPSDLPAATAAALEGSITSAEIVATVVSVGGIDEEGAANIIKQSYDIPLSEPLPHFLPVRFTFDLSEAE